MVSRSEHIGQFFDPCLDAKVAPSHFICPLSHLRPPLISSPVCEEGLFFLGPANAIAPFNDLLARFCQGGSPSACKLLGIRALYHIHHGLVVVVLFVLLCVCVCVRV